MLEDVLNKDDLNIIAKLFDKAWDDSDVFKDDMELWDGRPLSRVQCRKIHIIIPAVTLLLQHIRKLVPGFRIEDMLEQYFYWLRPTSTKKVVGHLDGNDDQDVVALVFSLGATGVLGIQPIAGDFSVDELRAWRRVFINSNSLYLMKGNSFVHEVRLKEGSDTDRAILVLFVRRAPQRGRRLPPPQKAEDRVHCKPLPGRRKGPKLFLYHDDETCSILKRGRGEYFLFPRTEAIAAGYAACQCCERQTVVASDDEDLDPDDGDEAGDDGHAGTSPDAHDDEATESENADSDVSEGDCDSKVEGRQSLISGMSGYARGLFPKPGVVFKKGDVVCRMPGQIWRLSTSKKFQQNPVAQIGGDDDLPQGYYFPI